MHAFPRPRRFAAALAAATCLIGASFPFTPLRAADALEAGFDRPPNAARPRTFWHWMNGNVTREGITLDLEAMHRIGMGGAFIFDGSTYLPPGPVGYLDPKWRALVTHAISEGNRLGMDVGIHNAPGWSSSGGPWIHPEQAMQQLVWTETTVAGGSRQEITLPHPQTTRAFYRDAFVVAFPALQGETVRYEDALVRVTAGGQEIPKGALSDGSFTTQTVLKAGQPLVIELKDPIDLYGLRVQPSPDGRFAKLQVEGSIDGQEFHPICTVTDGGRHGIVAPSARTFAPVRVRFIRAVSAGSCAIAEFVLERAPRLPEWPAKANFDYRTGGQFTLSAEVGSLAQIAPGSVIDLTSHLQGDRLVWDAPPGIWTILRIGHTPTGKENVAASAAGRGLECDKLSAAATELHFNTVEVRVQADAKAAGVAGPRSLMIDSYEAGMQNWTENMPAEFQQRAGYSIIPYLPALFGRIVGNAGISERFLYDFRRAQADMMAEYYYGRMQSLATQHGMTFYVEGYGVANFDELRIAGLPDVPETEFWVRTPWTPNRTVKMVSSAAHVYGKPVVASESFTGEAQTSRWLEYPYSMKTLGDEMFALGMNQIVFHRYAQQPHPTAVPGMTMGPYGIAFERTNTWYDHAKPWIQYLTRVDFMLRQGTYEADVLYYTGERAPDPSQMAQPVVPFGYTYDLVNTDVLLHRITVRDGVFMLPGGARYRLLALPPEMRAMDPALAARLREWTRAGAAILGTRPSFSPSLAGFPASEQAMLRDADAVWGEARHVFTNQSIGQTLQHLRLEPDFAFSGSQSDDAVTWQHRRLSDGDLYFVSNRQRRVLEVTASFRGMAERQAEIWRPESGEKATAALQGKQGDRALVALHFEPAESVFVLFRRSAPTGFAQLTRNGESVAALRATTPAAPDVSGDFTMAIWVKPDTDLRVMPTESTHGRVDETGKFYAIPADPGDLRFGAGHATAGLAVGRNGIFVVERSNDASPAVLVATQPVSGWTHVAVVYRSGKPRLYVDGKLVREGLSSGAHIHSGIGAPIPPENYVLHFPGIEAVMKSAGEPIPPSRGEVYYFEGNSAQPTTFPRALTDTEIANLAAQGVPAPDLPTVTGLAREANGRVKALAWAAGQYAIDGGKAVAADVPAPITVTGPWHVAFQPGRGAPAAIDLPELASLHLSADFGVRYFSGTATYSHALNVPAADLTPGRRVILQLGRVEVLAEVRINGQPVGATWKEPYQLDVTEAVHAGANTLEVSVTNLWPNRLIGDEHLPEESDFHLHDERGVEANGVTRLPDWYLQGEPKPPGGRVTFATWRFYTKDEPLLASGLLGPVRLLNPVWIQLKR